MGMFSLSMRYMKRQKKRISFTIIGVILAVALVSGTGLLMTSFLNMRYTQSLNENGSWHYEIFGVDTKSQFDTLKSNVLIKSAGQAALDTYAQAGLQPGADGKTGDDGHYYINLHEYDRTALSMMPYKLSKGRMPGNSGEIALQQETASFFDQKVQLGDKITLPVGNYEDHVESGSKNAQERFRKTGTRTFTVVGFFNHSVDYMQKNISGAVTLNPTGPHKYRVYVQMKFSANYYQSVRKALKDSGVGLNNAAINENGIVEWMGESSATKIRDTVISTFAVLAAIVLGTMTLVIRNSFAMSVSEKISQIGTLRCLGASPRHISRLMLSEALIVWAIALPVGLLSGAGAIAIVIAVVKSLGIQDLEYLRFSTSAWPFFLSAVLSFAAVMLSAKLPSARAVKIPMVEAVRGNAVYKGDRIRKTHRGHFTGMLFGFPGLLAAKNIRRNPGRFRTTALSVIVSVVMFISIGGFAIGIDSSIDNALTFVGGDYEFSSSGTGNGGTVLNSLQARAQKLNGVSQTMRTQIYGLSMSVPQNRIPSGYAAIAKEYNRYTSAYKSHSEHFIEVLQVDRANYGTLKFLGNSLSYDALLKSGGALLCQRTMFLSQGGRIAFADFASYKPGETIGVTQNYADSSPKTDSDTDQLSRTIRVKIAGLLSQKPWYAYGSDGYLVVPKENIARFDPALANNQDRTDNYSDLLEIRFKPGMELQTDAALQKLSPASSYLRANDNYKNARSERNGMIISKIFVYGFMGVIILICCVNVFNTINANLLTRGREIAMARAVGMSQNQLLKMLLLECALYGITGTFWGSVVGVPLLFLLCRLFNAVIMASLAFPIGLVLISFAASVIIGILAGIAPILRMVRTPIIEKIRADE